MLVCNLTYDQTNTKNVEKALFPNSFSLIMCGLKGGAGGGGGSHHPILPENVGNQWEMLNFLANVGDYNLCLTWW